MVIRETLPLYEGLRRNRVARERDGERHTQPIVPYYGTPVRFASIVLWDYGQQDRKSGELLFYQQVFPCKLTAKD